MSLEEDNWKRKSEGEAGWIWSYADLVSLLLAFFVMMFALSQTENDSVVSETLEELSKSFMGESEKQTTKKSMSMLEREARAFRYIVETSKDAVELEKVLEQVESNFSNQAKMEEVIEEMQKSKVLKISEKIEDRLDEKMIEFVFSSDQLFLPDESELSDQGKSAIQPIVDALKEVNLITRIEIKGVVDADSELPQGFLGSAKLASKAGAYFVKNGLDPDKIEVIGKGATLKNPELNQEFKRRVHVLVYAE